MEQVNGYPMPPQPEEKRILTEKKELRFLIAAIIIGIFLANTVFFSGFYLAFALVSAASVVSAAVYLLRSGCRLTPYSGTLLGLSLVICASFLRSNDGFVKLVMVCFLLVSANLGLCLLAGQNLRSTKGASSLLDAPRAGLTLGVGGIGRAARGLSDARKKLGKAGKNRSAVLIGLLIAVPVLAVLIPLLISADAAFEGLVQLLPEMDLSEPVISVLFGTVPAAVLYARGVCLARDEKSEATGKPRKGLNPLTANTVLAAVCLLYGVYLFSQLAYVSGSLAGILPAEFTVAEYARRGFFEMLWITLINLTVIIGAVACTGGRESRLSTRILCLILGAVTLFLIATAAAKMFMYIGGYGLTRLRVLTSVIMVFLGVTTVVIGLWLLIPKIPYMQIILITGLLIGSITAWADVDTVVAAYNVHAYQTGQLETVDMRHLCSLSDGATAYIARLTEDGDAYVAKMAQQHVQLHSKCVEDIRDWTIAGAIADRICGD